MNIAVIGGGPAGLYFALLHRKRHPASRIRVYERNRPADTFGWGVVFSDETLSQFESADSKSYRRIIDSFRYWRDIHTHVGGERVVSTGHGFAALSRKKLLQILHERCREVGVELFFETEVESLAEARAGRLPGWPADEPVELVLAADGVNSRIRAELAEQVRPVVDLRPNRFCWLGTDKKLDAFTFIFESTPHGLFQVHAYPFEDGLGTWIVECREEAWRSAGLDRASEADTVAFCEQTFARYLKGSRLLPNRSLWRQFPTIQCEHWYHDDVVLLGDAAHTAHYSIGSGTKLAMEDAIALSDAFEEEASNGRANREIVTTALERYQRSRWLDVIKTQKAAQVSLQWFEDCSRFLDQSPLRFTFNLMTRSKRITHENLRERDPDLVRRVNRQVWLEEVGPVARDHEPPPPAFAPIRLRGLELANRIVVSPMCQYSAVDGIPGDWHLVHLGSRAVGGAGLVMTEMTDIEPRGRITHGCAGLWTDEQEAGWRRIVRFVHGSSAARIGIQLAHAGRKGSAHHPWEGRDRPLRPDEGGWETLAPSPIPFDEGWPVPREMDSEDMDRVVGEFVAATRRAERAGFDLVEVHMAHGYLLSAFLSPLSNRRRDEHGGSLVGRLRFPLRVLRAVREAWPENRSLAVRLSASDWRPDGSGMTPEETIEIARALTENGCDLIDVSSGGNVADSDGIVYGRMYQVPFAERIRSELGARVMTVGAVLGIDHANTILAAGRADLVAMARPHLRDPYLTLRAAAEEGVEGFAWPGQYLAGRPTRPRDPESLDPRPATRLGHDHRPRKERR